MQLWPPEEIVVQDGVVHLWTAGPAAEREALRVAAENVPGVRRVEEHVLPFPISPIAVGAAYTAMRGF